VRSATTNGTTVPQPFRTEVIISPLPKHGSLLTIVVLGHWKIYRGNFDAFEVNGSYEFTWDDFKGEIVTRVVDLHGPEPGSGWEQLNQPPPTGNKMIMTILHGGDAKSALLENVGPVKLTHDPPPGIAGHNVR
jgi:hypothetical protein